MKKILFLSMSFALSSASIYAKDVKDGQYFYDHPEEIKSTIVECEEKIKKLTIEELEQSKNDLLCTSARLGLLAVNKGDLKKAILIEDEQGWRAYIDKVIKQKKDDEIGMLEVEKKIAELDDFSKMEKNWNNQRKLEKTFHVCFSMGMSQVKDYEKEMCDKARKIHSEMQIQIESEHQKNSSFSAILQQSLNDSEEKKKSK